MSPDPALVTLDDLCAAAAGLVGVAVHTPLLPARWAGQLWLKPENLQPIGAFKIRGAHHKLATLGESERARGVVTHSSGNHAQAVALAARLFGVKAVVVMPDVASPAKIEATRALGAEVVLVPPERRLAAAEELAARHGYAMVPPYDDPAIIAGQGTVGLEIVDDALAANLDLAAVLVPVGGGGLISGVAAAVKLRRPQVRVIGVEPELAADARDSVRRGERVSWPVEQVYRTAADGLRSPSVGELPWRHISAYVDDMVAVSEQEISDAVRALALRSRLVAEPSGAVTTAAHLFHGAELPDGPRVAVISGGNIAPAALAALLSDPAGRQSGS
ncbi:MAG TPA: threonine/serine dehydratase [Mycobacteriales bacterium]|jgi:Threonine dehydratase